MMKTPKPPQRLIMRDSLATNALNYLTDHGELCPLVVDISQGKCTLIVFVNAMLLFQLSPTLTTLTNVEVSITQEDFCDIVERNFIFFSPHDHFKSN